MSAARAAPFIATLVFSVWLATTHPMIALAASVWLLISLLLVLSLATAVEIIEEGERE